jgi:hypothetical protein
MQRPLSKSDYACVKKERRSLGRSAKERPLAYCATGASRRYATITVEIACVPSVALRRAPRYPQIGSLEKQCASHKQKAPTIILFEGGARQRAGLPNQDAFVFFRIDASRE